MAFAVTPSEKTFTIIFTAGLLALLVAVNSATGEEERCIDSCGSLRDGKYQSCEGCNMYANCSGGNITVLNCTGSLVWDDFLKQCRDNSSTCPSGSQCISSCTDISDIPDGNYQSCGTCVGYIACVGATQQYSMSCSLNTVWDDKRKECEHNSTTCQ